MGRYFEGDDGHIGSASGRDAGSPPAPARRHLLAGALSILFGLGVAALAVTFAGRQPDAASSLGAMSWLAAALVALGAGLWFAGAVQAIRILLGRVGLPPPRATVLLAAFGLGPLLLILFFYVIALAQGFASTRDAVVASAAALASAVVLLVGGRRFARVAGELLLSLFVWLLLLVAPALWGEPVALQAARFVLAGLRFAGLLP